MKVAINDFQHESRLQSPFWLKLLIIIFDPVLFAIQIYFLVFAYFEIQYIESAFEHQKVYLGTFILTFFIMFYCLYFLLFPAIQFMACWANSRADTANLRQQRV